MKLTYLPQKISNEIKIFNGLGKNAIYVLLSNILFEIAAPMIYVFSNSYFWYKTNDIKLIIFFNIFFYLFLPISFYLNGFFVKKIRIKYLLFFGLISQGVSLFLYIFSAQPNYLNTLIFGSILGFFNGFYWSNRNFIVLETTTDKNRDYYNGLFLAAATIIGIIFNSLYGNFIGHNEISETAKQTNYLLASFFTIGILVFSGLFVLKGRYKNPVVKEIYLKNPNKSWQNFRKIYFYTGVRESVSFMIPMTIILYVLNGEDLLGEANSLALIATAFIVYVLGRFISRKDRKYVILLGVFILIINSLLLILFYSEFYSFVFNTFDAIGNTLLYLSLVPLLQKELDKQIQNDTSEYKYIFDSDLFINFGRILGTVSIFIIIVAFGDETGLKFAPLFLTLANLLFLQKVFEVKD